MRRRRTGDRRPGECSARPLLEDSARAARPGRADRELPEDHPQPRRGRHRPAGLQLPRHVRLAHRHGRTGTRRRQGHRVRPGRRARRQRARGVPAHPGPARRRADHRRADVGQSPVLPRRGAAGGRGGRGTAGPAPRRPSRRRAAGRHSPDLHVPGRHRAGAQAGRRQPVVGAEPVPRDGIGNGRRAQRQRGHRPAGTGHPLCPLPGRPRYRAPLHRVLPRRGQPQPGAGDTSAARPWIRRVPHRRPRPSDDRRRGHLGRHIVRGVLQPRPGARDPRTPAAAPTAGARRLRRS